MFVVPPVGEVTSCHLTDKHGESDRPEGAVGQTGHDQEGAVDDQLHEVVRTGHDLEPAASGHVMPQVRPSTCVFQNGGVSLG